MPVLLHLALARRLLSVWMRLHRKNAEAHLKKIIRFVEESTD